MSGSAWIWRLEWCSLNKVYPVQTSEIQPKEIHSIMLCSGAGWLCVLLFFSFFFLLRNTQDQTLCFHNV